MIYDAVAGNLKRLKLKKLHDGIVKKGALFVSCADFIDEQGKVYDLDMLVARTSGGYKVVESVVHNIEDKNCNN